jgi:hypothetical protein
VEANMVTNRTLPVLPRLSWLAPPPYPHSLPYVQKYDANGHITAEHMAHKAAKMQYLRETAEAVRCSPSARTMHGLTDKVETSLASVN